MKTGEEDEEKVYSDVVRIYQLGVGEQIQEEGSTSVPEKKWIQRGRGELRLNVKSDEKDKARIVVRREKTHQLVINMPLFLNITCERASDTDLRLIGFSMGAESDVLTPESYLLRQRNSKSSDELYRAIMKYATNVNTTPAPTETKPDTTEPSKGVPEIETAPEPATEAEPEAN